MLVPKSLKPHTVIARRLVLFGLGMGFIVAGLLSFTLPPVFVSAEPQVTDPVKVHCQKVVPEKAKRACDDSANIYRARVAATHRCDPDASTDKKVACVEKNAKRYFDRAAVSKPTPDSAASFTDALEAAFAAAKDNPETPAPGFGTLNADDNQNCNPATDGTCAICSGSGPLPKGCIDCNKNNCADNAVNCTKDDCDFVKKYINPAINLLTVSFGLIAAGSLIMGAISYAASEGDSQKTAKAKDRIAKTLFAIIIYMFLYSFLQFLIPGGAFNR